MMRLSSCRARCLMFGVIIAVVAIAFALVRLGRGDTYVPPKLTGEIVAFRNGASMLHGVLYKPPGEGPFPAVLYNHGASPGMYSNEVFEHVGPLLVKHGWMMFAPYRRGQGLSVDAGPYWQDEARAAAKKGGTAAYNAAVIRVMTADHLNDQLAALAWMKQQRFVDQRRIAVGGNSFGGIQTILAAEREPFCAAFDGSGAAESWTQSPALQDLLTRSVRNSRTPVFFFQAENDYNLAPSKTLSVAMKDAGKIAEMKIYPAYGKSADQGHSLTYMGTAIWFEDAFRFLQQHCGS
jgi:carboxymethylenebutenolidase